VLKRSFSYACNIFHSLKIFSFFVTILKNSSLHRNYHSSLIYTINWTMAASSALLRFQKHAGDSAVGSWTSVAFLKPHKTFCKFVRRSNFRSLIMLSKIFNSLANWPSSSLVFQTLMAPSDQAFYQWTRLSGTPVYESCLHKSYKITSFPCHVAAAECDSDNGIRDEGETQHHLISNLFSNTNQRAGADLINSWRIRNAAGNQYYQ